jgi:hypothetical protein
MVPIILWLIIIGISIVIFGSVWHNVYKINQNDYIIGLVAPVNESVWEHTKLIIYPILLVWGLLLIFFFKKINNIFLALLLSTITGIIVMILIHYFIEAFFQPKTFSDMITGHMVNYILAIIASLFVLFYILRQPSKGDRTSLISLGLYILLLSLSSFWTYYPPSNNGIWYSPY